MPSAFPPFGDEEGDDVDDGAARPRRRLLDSPRQGGGAPRMRGRENSEDEVVISEFPYVAAAAAADRRSRGALQRQVKPHITLQFDSLMRKYLKKQPAQQTLWTLQLSIAESGDEEEGGGLDLQPRNHTDRPPSPPPPSQRRPPPPLTPPPAAAATAARGPTRNPRSIVVRKTHLDKLLWISKLISIISFF